MRLSRCEFADSDRMTGGLARSRGTLGRLPVWAQPRYSTRMRYPLRGVFFNTVPHGIVGPTRMRTDQSK